MSIGLPKTLIAASALAASLSPVAAGIAAAQIGAPGNQAYSDPSYPPQGQAPAQGGYDYRNPPPEPPQPQGYDGRTPPPPPQGYVAGAEDYGADARYAADAENWARNNCVKSRPNTGAGALVGGVLGAIIGGGLAGRHDTGAGMAAGAAVGAIGGAAVASSSGGATSPGCPPGFVVRGGAPAYVYTQSDYYYAAPGWYRPWVYVDNAWVYRPYPYHSWYYRTYRPAYYGGPGRVYYGGPRGYYGGRGGYGGWHGGYGGHRH